MELKCGLITCFIDSIIDADWVFTVARGSTLPSLDFGAVAVIDGSECKLALESSGLL